MKTAEIETLSHLIICCLFLTKHLVSKKTQLFVKHEHGPEQESDRYLTSAWFQR